MKRLAPPPCDPEVEEGRPDPWLFGSLAGAAHPRRARRAKPRNRWRTGGSLTGACWASHRGELPLTWYAVAVKRTFQVAVFGASNVANRKVLALLHRARGGELVDIPELTVGTERVVTRFFDFESAGERGLQARFRVSTVLSGPLLTRASYGLHGASGVVFVPVGAGSAAAWRVVSEHLATDSNRGVPVVIASKRPVRGVAGVLVPSTGAALASAIEAEVIGAFREGRVRGRSTTTPSKAYTSRANALAKAIEIALEVGRRDSRRFHESLRASALHPALGFATVASLAFLEQEFFTYWNESQGADVRAFWREVSRRRLPYVRRDVLSEVLTRGRVTSRADYDTVTDLIADERLTAKQRQRLDAMLGAYAAR